MIKGIDVSAYNGWPFSLETRKYYADSDFIIIKATQGLSYLYEDFKAIADKALADHKLIGFYHYAGGNDPAKEAEYFYNTISMYSGRAIPCIDFENYQNSAYNDKNWCRKFVERYHDLSGVWPMVYVSAAARDRVSNCADVCALWVAGYPRIGYKAFEAPTFVYSVDPWNTYSVWQFTDAGGTCDLNVAKLTREGWEAIATGGGKVKPVATDNVYKIARDVINGFYGNGDARKKMLGDRYDQVQEAVNYLLNASDQELRDKVLSGAFGNGSLREQILGSRYENVQKLVNESFSK